MGNKYEASNDFYECYLSKGESDFNEFGRVLLYPLLGFGYIVWLTLDFLFIKGN